MILIYSDLVQHFSGVVKDRKNGQVAGEVSPQE